MSIAAELLSKLRVPVIGAPMFIASTPELLIAQCNAGIIGSMPALNPRSTAALNEELSRIKEVIHGRPYAINVIAHPSNSRLEPDLDVILRHKVPVVILSLAANPDLVRTLQTNGSLVLQDVVKDRHARKCAEMGVDGIVAIANGAGGHTGDLSPFALVQEIREWWDGLLVLGGAIATGRAVLAAEVLGADLAYIGSPFLAMAEAGTNDDYRQMVVNASAADIVTTNALTGVDANFLKESLAAHQVDRALLTRGESKGLGGNGTITAQAWSEVWSAGQGVGAVKGVSSAADWIDTLVKDYAAAKAQLA